VRGPERLGEPHTPGTKYGIFKIREQAHYFGEAHMTPFVVVLGIVGAVLILVGLVGGGFTLSGSFMPGVGMPKVGNWVRLPCFSVGILLVLMAIGLGFGYNPNTPNPSQAPVAATTPATPAATTPATPASAQPSPQFANADAVVNQFYADITDHRYSAAWALGGDNLANGASYATWAAGYADTTASIALGTVSDFGSDQVQAQLSATQLDGSVKTYEGTYTVENGVIVAADIVQTS
jgi:hypothetical protein